MLTQRKALVRMENNTRTEMRRIEDSFNEELAQMWIQTIQQIRFHIHDSYRQDFGKETWDFVGAKSKGTLARISNANKQILHSFGTQATAFIKLALKHIREEERRRALWMIDQATPEHYVPVVPPVISREADNPRDAKSPWDQTFWVWLDTYHKNLDTNLQMEALHEGDIQDAADEAAATKIDNFDPAYKLRSMFASEAIRGEADARREVYDSNDDIVEEEIWMTLEDGRVCEICSDYDGKPLSEIDEDIPAHYNCRCYTRFVPKAWAAMLRSGNPEDRENALRMDDAGLLPDSMAIRSPKTGELIGRAIVTFEDWKNKNIIGLAR